MNITKLLLAGLFALVTVTASAADKKKTCCEKAKAEGKDCAHECCVKAKAAGEVCKKCNPDK